MNSNNSTTGISGSSLAADPLMGEAKHAFDDAASEASKVAGEARHKMAEVAGEAGEQAKAFAENNKGRIAGQISAFAGALDKAAEELQGSDQEMLAGYARDAAHGIENMSGALRERGVDDLMQSVQQFARTQPAAFLGIAALAGFAASRFAKASAGRPDHLNRGARSGTDSLVASSPRYPDGELGDGQVGQGLGSSSDQASWRSANRYPQTERGH